MLGALISAWKSNKKVLLAVVDASKSLLRLMLLNLLLDTRYYLINPET